MQITITIRQSKSGFDVHLLQTESVELQATSKAEAIALAHGIADLIREHTTNTCCVIES